ncbi:SprT family protein [Bacillus carboniphilus]|uniref:Protein SprT-like n=1 Tax=Bacillus carboniphilus TaxID=86663 RepID=A0ABY9JTJ9_9BACI|nr:SprT family protein [Bacillus carboniphilus]WLR42149.1 SprT family protein [Bacillus carboniphilus]
MNDKELQILVEKISFKYFNKPFFHRASFNKRLRTTGGRYLLKSHNIEINYSHYEKFGEKELEGIIKHELCHYHLHLEGKGHMHRDRDFKELLAKVGAPRYCKPLENTQTAKKRYVYQCDSCNHQYIRKKRMDPSKYSCGRCRGKIKLVDAVVQS